MAEHLPLAEVNRRGINYTCEGNIYEDIDILHLTVSTSGISTTADSLLGLFHFREFLLGHLYGFFGISYQC